MTRPEPPENQTPTAVFAEEFELAPLRPLVVAHALLQAVAMTLWICWPDSYVFAVVYGALAVAQWGLLSVWLFLGPKKTLRRIAFVAFFVLVAQLVSDPIPLEPLALVQFPLMWLSTAISVEIVNIPLTIIREKGIRLRRLISGAPPASEPLQFRISRLMAVTALAAILFGIVQHGWRSQATNHAAFGLAVMTLIPVAVTLYFSWTRVCVWIALYPGRVVPRLAVAAYCWLLALLLFAGMPGSASSGGIEAAGRFAASVGGFALTTAIFLTSLLLARRQGYYAIIRDE